MMIYINIITTKQTPLFKVCAPNYIDKTHKCHTLEVAETDQGDFNLAQNNEFKVLSYGYMCIQPVLFFFTWMLCSRIQLSNQVES